MEKKVVEKAEEKIQKISNKVFYSMQSYSQLVIDLVQEVEQLYINDAVSHENCGAKSYDVSVVLEIIDPARTHDIKVLNELSELLQLTIK